MNKYLVIFLLFSKFVFSQTTSVTATVSYPDGQEFKDGTVQATFTPPTGIIDQNLYLLNGSPFPYYVTGTMDTNGTFTIVLTDDHIVRPLGGRWMFTVCSPASVACTNSLQDVFGATIDLSTLISADVPAIFAPAFSVPRYFTDLEVDNNKTLGGQIYFNYISKTFRCWDGATWNNCGGGGGGGGITNFSAGNLSPLFTTSVSNSTTTPNLSFTQSTVASHTVYANETSGTALPSFQTDAFTLNTTSPLSGGGLVHLGGVLTLTCAGCLTSAVTSITATSPIVVTPSPITGIGVISCPTCGTSTGSVTSVGLAAPTGIGISGSPVTTTGTLTWSMPGGWIAGDLLLGNGSNSVTRLPIGTNNFVLTSNGTTALWQALAPPIIPDVQTRRVCTLIIGSDDGNVLLDTNLAPQGRQCFVPYAATLQEVDVAADGGTPSVLLDRNRAGVKTNILSAALSTAGSGGIACAKISATTGYDGTTTCANTLQNTTVNPGDYFETLTATAGGVAKRMSIFIVWTVN